MNNKTVAIIIPAYNETQNLCLLLKDITVQLAGALVIVVDDSGETENRKLSAVLAKDYPETVLVSRHNKLGRGSAVLRGMAEALKHKEIQNCFEMDADLAHSPAEFRRFLAVRREADLVIGSRYLASSRIVKWPLRRLIQSKLINAFLRVWLGLRLTDFTNGFRLYSRRASEFLVQTHLREHGFIALSEIAYTLRRNGFCITEVPISFTDRTYGRSNANLHELWNAFIGALKIRLWYNKHND